MNNIKIRDLFFYVIVLFVFALGFFAFLESDRAFAVSDSVVITLTVNSEISITSPADSSMSTALGVSQNTAVGTTTWNVKTNNSAGYTLAVKSSSNNPAMQTGGGSTISNDQVVAPALWSVSSGNAEFGFSAFGTDTTTGTWGSGTQCSSTTNVPSTGLKYLGLATSDVTIATRSSTTTPSGIDTTVCYAVEQNGFYVPSGTYTATVVATATAL